MTLDELVIKLLIDPSGVKQGAKEATASTAKLTADMVASAERGEKAQTSALGLIVKGWNSMAAAQRKAADASVQNTKAITAGTESLAQSGEKAIRTFGALFLLFAGANSLKTFVSDMIGADAALGRTAKSIGQTPEALSGIGRAVERLGGSFTGAVGGLKGLSDAFEQMRTTGNSAIMEPMARLQGLSGHAIKFGKDVHENFLSIADALKAEMAKDPAMADYLGRQILGDEGLTNLAKKGRAGILAEEAKSPKITKQQTEDAQRLQGQLAAVRQSFEDIGNAILMDFGPAMLKGITWVKDLVEANRGLIESKVSGWVKDVGQWFQTHKADVENFGKAVGDLATAAGSLATAFASQSPAMQALELFAAAAGGTVLRAVKGLSGALTMLFALPAPAWFLALNPAVLGTAAVAGVLASGDPNKSVLAGGRPDVTPQDNDLGLPGVDTGPSDTDAAKGKVSGAWSWFTGAMKKLGFGDRLHDDAKTKDNIEDTAKATREIRDLVKSGASLTGGITGVTASSGGIGGSGRHADGSSPGASLRDRQFHGRGYSPAGGGGTTPTKGAFAANQNEAYAAALKEGLNPTAARALVANMSGEGLANDAHRRHWDGTHYAQGIVQWDPTRTAAIKAQFGKEPMEMSIAEQTKAAIWEMKNKYPTTWRALQGDNAGNMIGALVDDYERPGNRPLAKAQRMGYYRGFNPGVATPAVAATPSTPVGDQAALDAQRRIAAGSGTPTDHATIAAHRAQQSTPPAHGKPLPSYMAKDGTGDGMVTVDYRDPKFAPAAKAPDAPTVGHAVRHMLHAIAHANKMLHHEGAAVPVEVTEKSAERIGKSGRDMLHDRRWGGQRAHVHHDLDRAFHRAASLDRMTRMAASGGGYSTHNVDRSVSSETRINGGIHIHSAATDAQGIAADIEPHLHRGQAAGRADYGLA